MEERQASHKWKGGSATISMVPIADRERQKQDWSKALSH